MARINDLPKEDCPREKALKNIDEGLKLVILKTKEFNINKGINFTQEQEDIYDKWSK